VFRNNPVIPKYRGNIEIRPNFDQVGEGAVTSNVDICRLPAKFQATSFNDVSENDSRWEIDKSSSIYH
jgi:hypothetical protein